MNKNVCKGVSLLLVVVAVVFAILGFSANNKYKEYSKLDKYYEDKDMEYFDNSGYDYLNDLRKDDPYYSDLYNKSHQYLYLKNKYRDKVKIMAAISAVSFALLLVTFILYKRNSNDELTGESDNEIANQS